MSKLDNDKADKYLKDILEQTQVVLGEKAKEYVRNEDRLHNFNQGALLKKDKIREEIIEDFRFKHEISRIDIVNDIKEGKLPTRELICEKYGDIVNYFIIEWMSILDRIDKQVLDF